MLQAFEELLFHVNINELMWGHPGLQGMTNSGYPNVASFRRTCKNRLQAANVPPNLHAGRMDDCVCGKMYDILPPSYRCDRRDNVYGNPDQHDVPNPDGSACVQKDSLCGATY